MIGIIDIGGTNIKYGIIDPKTEKYRLLGEQATETGRKDFQMAKRLEIILDPLVADYHIQGIAISTAGVVDVRTGKIVHANKNIPNYKGTNLKKDLENRYQLPVSVENDVNAALLGELTFGDYGKVHSALMLTIGTGVGGALYLNEEIYHGFSHSAGEVGYSIINGQNIEDLISTRALVENVAKKIDHPQIDGRWIFEQAIQHDNEVAITAIDQLVKGLAQLINNYVALINPEYLILGGGIMEQVDYLKPRISQEFKKLHKNDSVAQNTAISFASQGNQAGMLGAYVHFKKTILEN